jgi:hypothetical protein
MDIFRVLKTGEPYVDEVAEAFYLRKFFRQIEVRY